MVAAERGECEVKRGISQLMFLKGGDTRGAWVCRNDLCCWLDFFRIMADGYEERPLQGGERPWHVVRGMFECLLENYRDLFVGMDRCPCYSLTTADKTNLDHDMDVPLVKPSML